jgi:hypothetical protein
VETKEQIQGWAEVLACPRCRGDVAVHSDVHCKNCGRVGRQPGAQLCDFGGNRSEEAATVAAWPEELVRGLPAWADALAAGQAPSVAAYAELVRRHGLVGPDGALTPLGLTARYHLDEFRWQKGRKGLDGVLDLAAIGPRVRALDVGCGAGQTLRRLEPDRPVELFGADLDMAALALAARLARLEGVDLALVGARATALPFRPAAFDLVLTRVALNYMHQHTALAEMVRVLRPGGFLFCRVEALWHDLSMLRPLPPPKALVCRLRDLGWGTFHALTGWQPTPGGSWRGGRCFATASRLGRILSGLGCRTVRATESPNGPVAFGHRSQLIVVAQRRQSGKRASLPGCIS